MMPTGPFPAIAPPGNLYYLMRRRAKARKMRTVAALASVAILVGAGSVYAASSQHPTKDSIVVGGSVTAPTDSQLVAMASGCDSSCIVVGRIQTADDDTFAIIGEYAGTAGGTSDANRGALPNTPVAVAFVVAHGDRLVSALAPDTAFATYAQKPRTDATGNVIVEVLGGNNSVWYLPFRLEGSKLTLIQGTFANPTIVGDLNSGVVDTAPGQQLRIVTVGHDASSGQRVYTYKIWSWNGTVYVSSPCQPGEPTRGPGPTCGLPSYPS